MKFDVVSSIAAFIGFWVLVAFAIMLTFVGDFLIDVLGRPWGLICVLVFCGLGLATLYGFNSSEP